MRLGAGTPPGSNSRNSLKKYPLFCDKKAPDFCIISIFALSKSRYVNS